MFSGNRGGGGGGWGSGASSNTRRDNTTTTNNNNISAGGGGGGGWGSGSRSQSKGGRSGQSNQNKIQQGGQRGASTGGWGSGASNRNTNTNISTQNRNQSTGWGNKNTTTTTKTNTVSSGWGSKTQSRQQLNLSMGWDSRGNGNSNRNERNTLSQNASPILDNQAAIAFIPSRSEISCVKWASADSPIPNSVAAGSWDSTISLFAVQETTAPSATGGFGRGAANAGQTGATAATLQTSVSAAAPVMGLAFLPGSATCVAGCADGKVGMFDLATQNAQQLGAHTLPVRQVVHIPELGLFATGSWDKTVGFWDIRQAGRPAAQAMLPDKCYSMACSGTNMVVATAERQICLFDIRMDPSQPQSIVFSPLQHQTRKVVMNPTDPSSFVTLSVTGEMAFSSFSNPALDYVHPAFSVDKRPHHNVAVVAPLNDAVFLPSSSTQPRNNNGPMLATCSGDGAVRVHDVRNGGGDVTQQRVLEGSPYLGCCALDNQQGKFLALGGSAGPDPWMQSWSDFSAAHSSGNVARAPIKLEGQLVVLQVDGSQKHKNFSTFSSRGGSSGGGNRNRGFRR